MRLFPVFIDARPGYVSGSPDLSVLRMPLGGASVFGRLHADVGPRAPGRSAGHPRDVRILPKSRDFH